MKQHFEMMAAYNRWANGQVYAAAEKLSEEECGRDMGAFFKSVIGTLNHILVGDRIWLKRFTGAGEAPTSLSGMLFPTLDDLKRAREAEDDRIVAWIGSLSKDALAGRFTYMTVTDMRTVSQRLAPALSHFFNHQTHHRGQVHAMLTALGQPSLTLDLIHFQRIEEGRKFA